MSKLSSKEILEAAKQILGDRTDDDALAFLENLKDTTSEIKEDEWKTKYEDAVKAKDELDKSWRQRYRDTFFSGSDDNTNESKNTDPSKHANDTTDEIDLEVEAKKIRFDDLFNKVEEG